MKPLVSVLMTSYNTGKFIEEAIESLLAQTYTNWELLLADDCSTDNTRAIISRYTDPRIRVFHNDKNLHYLRTRNKLTQFVRGEYIALLDADDVYERHKLEKQLNAFEKDPLLGICGCRVGFMDEDGKKLSINDNNPLSYIEIAKAIKRKHVFSGSSPMIKTSTWKEVGGYRDFFNSLGYEDYDLYSRIIEKFKGINLEQILYIYRQYPGSTSRRDMIYNPFKMHGHLLIQHFINQRAKNGRDSLDENDIPAIINFIVEKNKPYVDDPSLIHRQVMWSHLHNKMYNLAYRHILIAIQLNPFRWVNYRTFILLMLISTGIIKE